MEKFTTLESKVAPLPIKDVDTDMILPAQFLTSTSQDGYGEKLFRRLRDPDPQFVTNLPEFQEAKVLAADLNFGCGSSREHAVWAIVGAGFRVVISKSFADIFYNNSAKNGLLLITLPEPVVDEILEGAKGGEYSVRVDLSEQIVTLPGGKTHTFDYDPFRKYCLINGLDDIDYIASHQKAIDEFRREQEANRFFSTLDARG